MRRFLIIFAVVILLLLPVVALAQNPVSTPSQSPTPTVEPLWPDFLPPVGGRMYDDLAHQRWVIDPATGDLAYRHIDPFLDVEVRGTRHLYSDRLMLDDGRFYHIVGVRWMDFRGRWHSEPWVTYAPMPPLSWVWR